MPEGIVNITFQADTSQMTQAFGKLNSELEGGGTRMVNWTNVQKQSAQAAEFMSQANYKTAASFKPATAEMRAASIATEELGSKSTFASSLITRLTGTVAQIGLAYEAARVAVEAFTYVVGASMELESADVRFKSLAGNTKAATDAFTGLQGAADETHTSVVDLSKAGITLLEAGVPIDQLTGKIETMSKQAKVAGEDVGEVANVRLRLSRGEVGSRDLAMISRLTADETGRLQNQYKEIAITIPRAAKEMEILQKATERTRQDTDRIAERHTQDINLMATRAMQDRNLLASRSQQDKDLGLSAQSGFLEKHGASENIFAAFQKYGGQGSTPYVAVPGMENVQGMGQKQVQSAWKQLKEGMAQIGKEEGISSQSMVGLLQSGYFGKDEITAASGRAREQRETAASRGRTDTDTQETRGRQDVDTQAARGRQDAGTAMQRTNEDLKTNLELRKESLRLQLVADAIAQLEGHGGRNQGPELTGQVAGWADYLQTAQGKADTTAYWLKTKPAQKAGSALDETIKSEAIGAQAQGEGIQEDSDWLRSLFGGGPSKAGGTGGTEKLNGIDKNTADTASAVRELTTLLMSTFGGSGT